MKSLNNVFLTPLKLFSVSISNICLFLSFKTRSSLIFAHSNASTEKSQWEKPEGFEEESKGIESVILFTLLTNNDPKKKCLIQINLLKDSLGFLKELVV